jgi:hypothetical protein
VRATVRACARVCVFRKPPVREMEMVEKVRKSPKHKNGEKFENGEHQIKRRNREEMRNRWSAPNIGLLRRKSAPPRNRVGNERKCGI